MREPQTSTESTASCRGIRAINRACSFALTKHRCCRQADPFSSLATRSPDMIEVIAWFCCPVAILFRILLQANVLPVEDNVDITSLYLTSEIGIKTIFIAVNNLQMFEKNREFDFSRTSGSITILSIETYPFNAT